MIIEMDDVLDVICDKFPDIKRSSIENICKKGLKGINKIMRDGDELFIKGSSIEEYKFFIPMTPEKHNEVMKHRFHKHKFKKENERKNSSK